MTSCRLSLGSRFELLWILRHLTVQLTYAMGFEEALENANYKRAVKERVRRDSQAYTINNTVQSRTRGLELGIVVQWRQFQP